MPILLLGNVLDVWFSSLDYPSKLKSIDEQPQNHGILTDLEKQIVSRTSRLMRVRNVKGFRSIF